MSDHGPLEEDPLQTPACAGLLEAADAMRLPINDDFNDGEQDDFRLVSDHAARRRRASTVVAYLHPIMDRPNVSVETYAQVAMSPSTRLSRSPSDRRT